MKAAFYTLGCKVNQYETEYMSELLKNAGFEIVPPGEDADFYIVNSCTVTATADQKTRQNVRKFKRRHPGSAVILTGCMPQAFPREAEELEQADIVISNKSNGELLDIINKYNIDKNRIVKIEKHRRGDAFSSYSVSGFKGRIRAFVKIEDGCDRYCSYCIIPMSRGFVRSKNPQDLKEEIKSLGENGIKEVVLVGINLFSYGKGEDFNIIDAVRICENDENIKRVRLGSLEPDFVTEEMIEELSKCGKLCPQFHLSLQSGCDKTLREMNRHYTADEFRRLVKKLRSEFNDAVITTDVMTGFNNETEDDFEKSLAFIKEMRFEKVHTFPYSEREGTAASKKGDNVPRHIKEERAKTVIEESEKIRREFMKSQKGRTYEVLFESRKGEFCRGYTTNYIPVCVKSERDLTSKELPVKLCEYDEKNDVCPGELIQ